MASVELTLRDGSGKYFTGTGFTSNSEVWLTATGTTVWSYSLGAASLSDGGYTIQVRAVDGVAQTTTPVAGGSFTFDRTAPSAGDIQPVNKSGGTAGRMEIADTLVYTFSEAVSPSSILAGWSGASTNVVVRLNNDAGAGGFDTVTVYNSSNTTQLNLGVVDLGNAGHVSGGNRTYGATGTVSTMVMSGSTVTITLGSGSGGTLATVASNAAAVWTPSASVLDLAGNAMDTTTRSESGANDRNL